jgi:hypothetical protein
MFVHLLLLDCSCVLYAATAGTACVVDSRRGDDVAPCCHTTTEVDVATARPKKKKATKEKRKAVEENEWRLRS